MPIRTCLFDLGNVLVYFCHERMIDNVAAVSDVSPSTVRQVLIDDGLNLQLECGRITEQEFHQHFQQETDCTVAPADLKHAIADIFTLNEPMLPLLDELRTLDIRLVLLSNTSKTHIDFVRNQWPVLDRFDAITTSWEVGALKPDPRIYESAVANANCNAGDCFYTDDIEDYVKQAVVMGIQAEVYRNAATTRAALRARDVRMSQSSE